MDRQDSNAAKFARRRGAAKPQTIRLLNSAAVMQLIRAHQPISRAELARLTGIHRSNISLIVDELQGQGLLREEQAKHFKRGRTPTLISLSRERVRVLAVSVRHAKTTVALASLDANVESTYIFDTPEDPKRFIAAVDEANRVMMQHRDTAATNIEIRQIVVSIPGIVAHDKKTPTVWIPSLPRYSELDIAAELTKRTKVKTSIGNNAGLAAMAVLHSAEKEKHPWQNDFVFLVIGDVGVGSGVVIQRTLYSGYDAAYAGEVGHTVIDPNGPPCSCGRHGCWQLYVCDAATWARVHPDVPHSAELFKNFLEDVRRGNRKAVATVSKTAEYLSLGISNIVLMLNPERILLAGALTEIWPVLERELRSAFFLPHHHSIIQPIDTPVDTLFLRGAIDRAIDLVLERAAEKTPG